MEAFTTQTRLNVGDLLIYCPHGIVRDVGFILPSAPTKLYSFHVRFVKESNDRTVEYRNMEYKCELYRYIRVKKN